MVMTGFPHDVGELETIASRIAERCGQGRPTSGTAAPLHNEDRPKPLVYHDILNDVLGQDHQIRTLEELQLAISRHHEPTKLYARTELACHDCGEEVGHMEETGLPVRCPEEEKYRDFLLSPFRAESPEVSLIVRTCHHRFKDLWATPIGKIKENLPGARKTTK